MNTLLNILCRQPCGSHVDACQSWPWEVGVKGRSNAWIRDVTNGVFQTQIEHWVIFGVSVCSFSRCLQTQFHKSNPSTKKLILLLKICQFLPPPIHNLSWKGSGPAADIPIGSNLTFPRINPPLPPTSKMLLRLIQKHQHSFKEPPYVTELIHWYPLKPFHSINTILPHPKH